MATTPYPAPSAPSLALSARPALSMPLSPSSLPLSAPAVLPSLTSFVSYLFRPARAPFPRPCRPSLHDTTQAHFTLQLLGAGCLVAARRGTPPCPVPPHAAGGSLSCGVPCHPLLCPAFSVPLLSGQRVHGAEQFARQRSLSEPLSAPPPRPCFAPCLPALSRLALPLAPGCRVSGLLPLCPPPSFLPPPLPYPRPPASASTVRSSSRGNPPSLLPPSAPAPWPSPAPRVFVLPRPPLLPFPGPWVPGPLSPCPRPRFSLPAYTSRSNTRGTSPTPSSPCSPLAPWLLGLWHACRIAPACGLCPSTPALPPPPSPALLPPYRLRRTLCRQVARMSQARTWPSSHDATQDTAPLGVDRFVAARRGAPPCPVPPRTAGGSLGCGAPMCFCPTFAPSCRRGTPSSLPCLLRSSALRPARARRGAIREAALPLCPLSCRGPRALSCPLSAHPPSSSLAPLPMSLGPWPFVSLSPSSLHPPGIHFAEQYARHPPHSLFTLPPPGALVPSAPACGLWPSTPALPPPPSPALFPLYTSQDTTQDTL